MINYYKIIPFKDIVMNLLPVFNYTSLGSAISLLAPVKLTRKNEIINDLSRKILQGCAWGTLVYATECLWTASKYTGDYCYIQMIQPRNPLVYVIGAAPLCLSLASMTARRFANRNDFKKRKYIDQRLDKVIEVTIKIAALVLFASSIYFAARYKPLFTANLISSILLANFAVAFGLLAASRR